MRGVALIVGLIVNRWYPLPAGFSCTDPLGFTQFGGFIMKRFFLVLAVLGAILPYIFFLQFFTAEGVNLSGFVSAWFANGAVGGLTADLLFTSFVFWAVMFYWKSKKGGPSPTLFIILNLAIGLSCALPAYLYTITEPTS
jgi:hypothetical protein